MTDESTQDDRDAIQPEANPNAPLVNNIPIQDWGDELLKRLRALGHNNPGIVLAVIGDQEDVNVTSNMPEETLSNFLDWLAAKQSGRAAGGMTIVSLGDIAELFGSDDSRPN